MMMKKKYIAVVIALGMIAFVGVMVYLLSRAERVEQTGEPEADRALAAEGYAGAESCRPCHGEAFATWSRSAHAEAMAQATPPMCSNLYCFHYVSNGEEKVGSERES